MKNSTVQTSISGATARSDSDGITAPSRSIAATAAITQTTIWISPSRPAASTLPESSDSGRTEERTTSIMRLSFSWITLFSR